MNEQNNLNQGVQPINGMNPPTPAMPSEVQGQINNQIPVQPIQSISQDGTPLQQEMPQSSIQQVQQMQPSIMNGQEMGIQSFQPMPQDMPQQIQSVQQVPVTPGIQPVQPNNMGMPVQQTQQVGQTPEAIVGVPQPQYPQTRDAVQQTPVNPVGGSPVNPTPVTSAGPTPGVFGPSVPIDSGMNATQVGFLPSGEPLPKKKNKFTKVIIIIIILAIIAAVGYFVVYPYVMKTYFSDPGNVYDTTIKEFYKGIEDKTTELLHTKAIYDIDLTLDSNIEVLQSFSGYSYGINAGVDPSKKTLQTGIKITNNKTQDEISYFDYIKNGNVYKKYSNYRDYIYAGEADYEATQQIFGSYEELINGSNKLDSEDVSYLINKLSELTISSIDKDKLSKEDTTIEINGETLKVTDNKYVIDRKTAKEMTEHILNGIKEDSKAIKILAEMSEVSEDEVKEMLEVPEEGKDTKKDDDFTITTSIYTYGKKNDIIGFGAVTSDGDFNVYYYNYKENFILKGVVKYDDEETGKNETNTLEIVGTKNGKKTNVVVKVNDKEIAELTINSWDDKNKDFDYKITYDDTTINGNIKISYDVNDKRCKFSFEGDVNIGSEYIKVSLNINEDWSSEVANINIDSAATLSDEELQNKQQEFMQELIKTPLGQLFKTVSGDYNIGIDDYYNQNQIITPEPDENENQIQNQTTIDPDPNEI